MGMYVNETSERLLGTSFLSKCIGLIADGAEPIVPPTEFKEDLVCVVDNGPFAAAAYAYDEREMKCFLHDDGRLKQWFIWDKVKQFAKQNPDFEGD